MEIILGKERENVRENNAVAGTIFFCWAPTSSPRVRPGHEKLLTFYELYFCWMCRLSRRRQNSTEVLLGNLPALYRIEYSFQGLLCRVEVPKYTLEHRTGKKEPKQQPGVAFRTPEAQGAARKPATLSSLVWPQGSGVRFFPLSCCLL